MYVSHLASVVTDDLIFSSGQGLVFPEGFCLGKIVKQTLKEKALYYEIEIEPLVDLASLFFCLLTNQSKIDLF
jgi:cell shape-determining protein MreC